MNIFLRDLLPIINPCYEKFRVCIAREQGGEFVSYNKLFNYSECKVLCITALAFTNGDSYLSFVLEKV